MLCESSLRSFIPWIMDDMYWIRELSNFLLGFRIICLLYHSTSGDMIFLYLY